jgi:hypothetical protein
MSKKPVKKLENPQADRRKDIRTAISKAIVSNTKKIKAVKIKFK